MRSIYAVGIVTQAALAFGKDKPTITIRLCARICRIVHFHAAF
jgi:hypothetical protein